MSDQDLTREFQTKCVVAENVTDSENNNNDINIDGRSHQSRPCSFCDTRSSDARTSRSCQAQTKSHSNTSSAPECRYDEYLPKRLFWSYITGPWGALTVRTTGSCYAFRKNASPYWLELCSYVVMYKASQRIEPRFGYSLVSFKTWATDCLAQFV